MEYQDIYKIRLNQKIAKDVYKMVLEGETKWIQAPGQFINIKINDSLDPFLRRPISVCDYDETSITIIYKILGVGTEILSRKKIDDELDILVGLGNGFMLEKVKGSKVLLVGGGVGVPPMFNLAKQLKQAGREVVTVLGFNSKQDAFYHQEMQEFGDVFVTTVDGTLGTKGFVTDKIKELNFDYYMCCGPEAMLKALGQLPQEGQLSFEEKMGCGFGACMGCSCKTIGGGYKRICVEGPVLESKEVVYE